MDGLTRTSRVAAAAALVAAGAAVALAAAAAAGPLEIAVAGQTITLQRPAWLALLGALPLVGLAAAASQTDFSPRRRLLQTALRGLFLAALALALAAPAVRRDGTTVAVVALADVSASVSDAQLAEQAQLLDELRSEAARRGAPLRVVRFGAVAEELAPGAPLQRLPDRGGDDTDLGGALSLALGLIEPDHVARVVLLGDGRATTGDGLPEAARARARGVRVLWRAPAEAASRDVAVLDLQAPDQLRPRASFPLEVRLVATHAGQARLRLTRDGRPHEPTPERVVALEPGLTTVRWDTQLDRPGQAVYRVEVAPSPENGRPENDTGVLALAPRAPPRVLVVEGAGASGGALLRALAPEGFVGEARPARAVRGPDPFAEQDLVVLADVGRAALPAGLQEALDRYVREGGGLLIAGGPESFGLGGPAATRLEQLLPLQHDPTDRREEATLALALVIDRSGSMSGPKMQLTVEAARGTAQMLAPDDLISVVVFDSQAHPVVRLQAAANRQRILNDIAQIRASGGTNILPGLREAFEQLVPARARKKHVILLSDGQSSYEGISELVDDAVAAHITVSAVGVGEGADQTLLQMIAGRGGGRFYNARDPASIPQIFTRETAEVSTSSAVEEATRMQVVKRSEMLAGLALESAPPLRGHARTRARREAEVLVATTDGAPLLARWQVGLGQVVAWASDLGGRWAADLARWPQFPKLWAQVARATMRRGAANQFPLQTRLEAGRAVIRIDAVAGDGQPLGQLRGTLEVVEVAASGGPPAPPRRLPLRETAPGVYEAELEVGRAGALLLSASLVSATGDRVVAAAEGRLALPFGRELMPPVPGAATGRALLAAIAQRTGGGPLESAAAAWDAGADRVRATRPLRIPLLLGALLLFLADVTIRRVRLPRLWRTGRGAAW